MPNKLLLLAFRFPPYSRVGAYRWTMLGSRLARLGHELHVLTVPWPPMGYTDWLEAAEEPGIVVHRIRSGYPHQLKYRSAPRAVALARSALLRVGDRLLGSMDEAHYWGRYLVPRAERLIDEHRIDRVIATGAPFNTNYWAARLRERKPHIRLVQDFRDPWFTSKEELARSRYRERFEIATQKADALVAVTPEMSALFRTLSGNPRTHCVPNGVALEKVRALRSSETSHDFVYIGALFNRRDVPLARFLRWVRKRRDVGRPVSVRIIGRFPDGIGRTFRDLVASGHLRLEAPLPQREALSAVAQARFALHVNGPVGLSETQVTTKIVEHAALRRPTVSLNYGGAVETFVARHDLGWSIRADASDFEARLDHITGAPPPDFTYDVDEFDYACLARQYSDLLESL